MILDLFSKRNKPLPDVFTYDTLPSKLRVQVTHILRAALGQKFYFDGATDGWRYLSQAIAAEHGLLELPDIQYGRYEEPDYYVGCMNYILKAEPEQALDMLELSFRFVLMVAEDSDFARRAGLSSTRAQTAIADLNYRFRENGVGFQFEDRKIIRVDSQLLHAEAVKPALLLLSTKGFEGPNAEFLAAHEHFRHNRIEPAITEACKAFESTMKVICDSRRWAYDKSKATASTLIKVLIDNGLVPSYSEEQLRAVEKCLLGVATVRNKNAGHGAGAKPRDVPQHYVSYALHLAASNIVFLVECHKAK
jgi:AbiJ N-terminal domain 4